MIWILRYTSGRSKSYSKSGYHGFYWILIQQQVKKKAARVQFTSEYAVEQSFIETVRDLLVVTSGESTPRKSNQTQQIPNEAGKSVKHSSATCTADLTADNGAGPWKLFILHLVDIEAVTLLCHWKARPKMPQPSFSKFPFLLNRTDDNITSSTQDFM